MCSYYYFLLQICMKSLANAITMPMAHDSYISCVFRRRAPLFVKPRTHFTTDLPSQPPWRRKTNPQLQIVKASLRKDVLIHNNTSEEFIPTMKNIENLRELRFPQVERGSLPAHLHVCTSASIWYVHTTDCLCIYVCTS